MSNALATATSPYLLQHKDNPVAWREWSPAMLEEARRADRPVLLSVGYAACHWCHVMAHESFENEAVAEAMNRNFICVKVDREERPDIDAIYQQALALMGEQGGWPLTMFLTPDGEPFWGGTYFPPEPRFGRPGFSQVLDQLAGMWRADRQRLLANKDALREALGSMAGVRAGAVPDAAEVLEAARQIGEEFDAVHGGIAGAPKFPQAPAMRFLWQAACTTGDETLEQRLSHSFERMAQGGIYDHLAGGFARYSVDAFWLVPHFEKMLYDNAQLVELLTLAHLRSGDALFARRVTETIEWLQTEMTTGGGLASAIDADSEGEEGRFYVWTAEEIDRLLGADAAFFRRAYGVTGKGNWEGKNILNRLHVRQAPDEVEESRLARCRARLLEARGRRTRPLTDDKVLTDWNGLAIHAIATAGMSLDRSDWIEFATQLFERILATHARDDTLVHSHRNGRALELAFLDDYAQMMRAALTLFEATGEERYLERLQAWNGEVQAHFADGEGGYYLHGPGTEELIVRGRNAHDGPTPSANGTLALVLERLGRLTGDPSATQQARTLVERFALDAARNPFAHATLLSAALALERPAQVVLIDAGGDERRAFVEAVRRTARPDVTLQIVSRGAALAEQHPAHGKSAIDGRCTAYVCIGPTCLAPVTDAAALEALLRAPIAATS